MVERASPAISGLFLDVLRIRSLQGERLSLPVRSAYSPYARFEHIRGVPSAEGGVPIFKLRVLDKLIDRLLAYGEPAAIPETAIPAGSDGLDSLIDRLQQRLRRQVLGRASAFGGQFPDTGMLIDLVA
jgi:hypothetical protein